MREYLIKIIKNNIEVHSTHMPGENAADAVENAVEKGFINIPPVDTVEAIVINLDTGLSFIFHIGQAT